MYTIKEFLVGILYYIIIVPLWYCTTLLPIEGSWVWILLALESIITQIVLLRKYF